MDLIDPDKKVEKLKKERDSIYQSSQHPEPFENEGSEYISSDTLENNDKKEGKEELGNIKK